MKAWRRQADRRHPSAVLAAGTLCVLAGCQGAVENGASPSESATDEAAGTAHAPHKPGGSEHCTTVTEGIRIATAGGVVAGPFDNLATGARKTGVAKFWVATEDQARMGGDAVIRVEVAKGNGQGDPAVYLRPAENMVTVTPAPENGVDKIYNGTIAVPTTAGTTLRITVTIGEATGCFLSRLQAGDAPPPGAG